MVLLVQWSWLILSFHLLVLGYIPCRSNIVIAQDVYLDILLVYILTCRSCFCSCIYLGISRQVLEYMLLVHYTYKDRFLPVLVLTWRDFKRISLVLTPRYNDILLILTLVLCFILCRSNIGDQGRVYPILPQLNGERLNSLLSDIYDLYYCSILLYRIDKQPGGVVLYYWSISPLGGKNFCVLPFLKHQLILIFTKSLSIYLYDVYYCNYIKFI